MDARHFIASATAGLMLTTSTWSQQSATPATPQSSSGRIVSVQAAAPAQAPAAQPMTIETVPAEEAPNFGGALMERAKLAGDWGGARNDLAANGITADFSITQFYQGVTRGGINNDFEYGGKGDLLINIDGTKGGFWKGGFVTMRTETRLGQAINRNTGAFMPAATPMLFPSNSDMTAITNLTVTQFLSESFGIYLGKINTLDGDANAYASGRGLTQFSNLALVFNPIAARTVPASTLGAGFVVLADKQPILNVGVIGATDTIDSAGFNDAFDNGAVFLAELRLPTCFMDKPGHQLLGGTYSTRSYRTLESSSYAQFPPFPAIGLETGTWCLYYNFDQTLFVDPCDAKRGWGLFGRAGIADQDINPFSYFLSVGIGGNSPFRSRSADTFGIGWFHIGLIDDVKGLAIGINDETGVELFYNIAVTPWCHITPDVQFLDPALAGVANSVVFGLRAKVDF